MKKIIFYLVTLFCIVTICQTLKINAAASWQTANFTKTQIGDGVYLEYYRGTSKSDFNSTTQANGRYQDIYTINMDKDTTAKVVVWGKSGNSNSWGVTTLEDISRDYEAKHPDKMVIAATNNWLADTQANNRGELDAVQVIGGLNYRVSDKQGTNDPNVSESFGHGYIPRPNMLGFDKDGNAYFTDDWNNGENYASKLQLSFYIDENNKELLNLSIDKINQEPNDGEIAILFPNYDGNNAENKACISIVASKYPMVTLVTREKNGGKGQAMKDGVRKAYEMGLTHILQIDSDGQHDTGRVEYFWEQAKKHPDAIICGYPEYDASAPKKRVNGRKIANGWIHIVTLSKEIVDEVLEKFHASVAMTADAIEDLD